MIPTAKLRRRGRNGPTVWTFDANRARSRSRSLRPAGSSDHPRSISQYHRELSPRADRPPLLDYAPDLPGARVLDERYGVNLLPVPVRKVHAGRLTALSEFVEEAKSSGLVATSIERAGLRAQRPQPRRPYGCRLYLEDATDNLAVGKHIVVVVAPLAGRARG